jgi:hypothetical protein
VLIVVSSPYEHMITGGQSHLEYAGVFVGEEGNGGCGQVSGQLSSSQPHHQIGPSCSVGLASSFVPRGYLILFCVVIRMVAKRFHCKLDTY